ncbi:MAG: alpha/beta hydrolase [Rhodococcus sp. (in: high G+C Gram-positive bacteria)]|uniref:alpha/beta hydrolase n=1 Tax=Rhodococcus sp. TaxID=1831 RepID=UPI003BB074A9
MPTEPVLEPAAQEFADATAAPPFLYDLPVEEGRAKFEEVQAGETSAPPVEVEDRMIPGGPSGEIPVRIIRPEGSTGVLPVIQYNHGAGWVFGSPAIYDRLIRELAVGADAALVFPDYSRSPEARYPTAIEEIYATAEWIADNGSELDVDPTRFAVAGDSVGGNMTIALTLMAKERGGPRFCQQVLFYPVTDAGLDTESYRQFAQGYFLTIDAMTWFWDQYISGDGQRSEILASPLRATKEQLTGLPPALVINGEADVLRDEGEAYANKLRAAGVPVTAVRFQGMIHDFVMLNALKDTHAARTATALAITTLRNALQSD